MALPRTILHVEDEPGMRELVRETLETDGWQICSAPSGQEGIALLAEIDPTILLLDHSLPDMFGTQFLDALCARGRKPPPFIITTGVGDELLAVQMMKRGAADYLVKDSRFLEQLAVAVRRVAHELDLDRRLAESEAQLQFLAQHSADVLMILESSGTPRYISPVALTITGYDRETFALPLLPLVHPEDVAQLTTVWLNFLSTPGAITRAAFRVLCKSGEHTWFEAVAQNHLENPAVRGIIANLRDISERKAAEQSRLDMERRLLHSQKLESLGVLAGGIAHDFNNLLAAVIGNLELARSDLVPESDSLESVELAMKAAQRAADLTRQMLAYSGRGTFAIESIDLSELVRENADIFSVSVSRSIELRTSTKEGLPRVKGDRGQLQQIVMNLLTNASEAIGTHEGTITLSTGEATLTRTEIEKSLVEPRPEAGHFASLAVADTGCGMTAAVLERLFDPFFTTKRTGRGLGMAAVLGIVRGHRGALFVDSSPGKGTIVRVLFPTESVASRDEATARDATARRNPLGFRARVLVVDDDDAVRSMSVRLLAHLGCEAIQASSGREAVDIIGRGTTVDVVLMDLTMPNLGGLETTALLRERKDCPPIVLCSGFGEESVASAVEQHGASAFLKKPYRLSELQQVLGRLLKPNACPS